MIARTQVWAPRVVTFQVQRSIQAAAPGKAVVVQDVGWRRRQRRPMLVEVVVEERRRRPIFVGMQVWAPRVVTFQMQRSIHAAASGKAVVVQGMQRRQPTLALATRSLLLLRWRRAAVNMLCEGRRKGREK